jgi:phosphonoacetate hydrolase
MATLPGIEVVLDRARRAARFELPPDRMGDLVVVSERHTVVGTERGRHDLSGSTRRCARTAGSASSGCRCW